MNINNDKKQNRKRKFRSKCYRSKKVKGFKGVSAHVKKAIESSEINSTLVQTNVNEPFIDFDITENSVENDVLVNGGEQQPGPSVSPVKVCDAISVNKNAALIKYRALVNRSREKLRNSAFRQKFAGKTRAQTIKFAVRKPVEKYVKARSNKIINSELLAASLESAAICGHCKHPKSSLKLYENPHVRKGLVESLSWQCTLCHHSTDFSTGKRCGENKNVYDTNLRSVYASQTMGRAGLVNFCSIMDLAPPVNKAPYNKIQNELDTTLNKQAETVMKEAASRVILKVCEDDPDSIELNEKGEQVANIAVTVDGTWQKRGHASKIGVVFVLSVLTGEVLDYELKSLTCNLCVSNRSKKNETEFNEWFQSHESACCVNHAGSSDFMETEGAKSIFLRSISTRNLRYKTFVGDGDSSCFGVVAKACAEKYGDEYIVVKEECVGHVQKRMGSRMRNYKTKSRGLKLSDGKTVGGKGRLTDKAIDKIQNFYGQCIRNYVGDLEGMKDGVWAIFGHMICNDDLTLEEQHNLCPKGKDSWCKYWSDNKNYNGSNRLPAVFIPELKPIFKDLTKENLLNRCLRGLTQNQNEALNGVLWSKCPKYKFSGKRKVNLAICDTICQFNTGSANKAVILGNFGIDAGTRTLAGFEKTGRSKDTGGGQKSVY